MLCPPGRRVLPWAMLLLLLLGFQPLETQAWCSEKDMYTLQLKTGDPNFSPTLEFALQKFNQQNKDQYAYKLVQVLSSETKKMSISTIYSMTLELGRTVCGKSEGDINDCPLQDSPEQNHTSTCLFIINTQKLAVSFSMLKKNCSE
uniref:putative cystatin-9-like protein CST9LP1 n=1 Tax=Ictidomys tridecemlineatus TaxID=43179 RepID=UPI00025DD06D|nr:putative cystatin-9-like protein CST9LP1 [Ictidomys tridecemlineatus]XP_040131601.1 putative cystatin-9-like protein CST9LP1 [Ictidomys tridecemlineatus]XP_040131602.1 putative cystatin-9-like protein CST9LP1 [Ictidomys tridecemlineatus]XP_040131603.1 putative cystatin-9-like protein CST9LP1 [Ictidomys tridecemlineatus]XP_040131604.1 putative cystatin-9-like protein CST9LP1 [Ictidomys tridecemlineatus]